jgi:hypothetical protein
MARKRARFEQAHLQHNLERWFTARQRIFVYHYINHPEIDAAWRDLATTGCCYRGWSMLSNFHRGEIWTYPTQKHFMLVQMLVTRDTLITRADWRRLKKENQQKDRQWQQEIRTLIKKHGETYTWWGEER